MKREIIWVEPLSMYLEKWRAPTSAVTRLDDTINVSRFPPFDPTRGEVDAGTSIRARSRTDEALS
jgi:2-iminobutanoate/2-iminopropanoate deaminase